MKTAVVASICLWISMAHARPEAPSAQYGVPSSGYGRGPAGFGGGGRGGGGGGGAFNDPLAQEANYNFMYEVQDAASGNDFGHMEMRQGEVARGSYHVLLPDGRMQKVDYIADQNGYMPTVSYSGEAKFGPGVGGGRGGGGGGRGGGGGGRGGGGGGGGYFYRR